MELVRPELQSLTAVKAVRGLVLVPCCDFDYGMAVRAWLDDKEAKHSTVLLTILLRLCAIKRARVIAPVRE